MNSFWPKKDATNVSIDGDGRKRCKINTFLTNLQRGNIPTVVEIPLIAASDDNNLESNESCSKGEKSSKQTSHSQNVENEETITHYNNPIFQRVGQGEVKLCEIDVWSWDQICLRDHRQRSPLLWASFHGQFNLVERILIRAKILCNIIEHDNIEENSEDADLSSFHRVVHAKGDEQETALHLASVNGQLRCVEVLLKIHGEYLHPHDLVNMEDENGCTALHFAALNDHVFVAKRLLECGANILKPLNVEGDSPVTLALKFNSYNVQLLFERTISATLLPLLG